MDVSELYKLFEQYPEVTTDTRNCSPNSIFFALKGEKFNGNGYALTALENGCSYAIVDENLHEGNDRIILVDDCLGMLQKLANFHRRQLNIPIVAITGTNGKTTTKELVTAVLAKSYRVVSTIGNLNNHIGVPLTLLRIKKEDEIAIIEMGANHLGEIAALAAIAEPNFGLITNVGHAHLEGFGSFENIIKAKGELYDYIRTRKDGKIFRNADDACLRDMAEDITSILYAQGSMSFVSGRVIESNPCLKFEWKSSKDYHPVQTHLIGDYNLSNALAAVAIGTYFGVESHDITQALEEYEPKNNRSQLYQSAQNKLIIDAYNANPTSMMAALENFVNFVDLNHTNSNVLILGDMRELGATSVEEHQKIIDYICQKGFHQVYLIGNEFGQVKTSFKHYKDVTEFISFLKLNPFKDKTILIKGSHGIQLEKCIELL